MSQNKFMPDAEPQQRLFALQNNADKIQRETYTRHLTEDEVDLAKSEFTRLSMNLEIAEDHKKSVVKGLADEIKSIKLEAKQHLRRASSKTETVTDDVYYMADFESSMMMMYDRDGELVGSRRLYPEERQGRIPYLKAVPGQE